MLRRVRKRIGTRHCFLLLGAAVMARERSSVSDALHIIDQLRFLIFSVTQEDAQDGPRRKHSERQPGESYPDALSRVAGERDAARRDVARLEAELAALREQP